MDNSSWIRNMVLFVGDVPIKRVYHKSVIVYGLETEIIRAIADTLPALSMSDEVVAISLDIPIGSSVEDVLPSFNMSDEVKITLKDVEV